MNQSFFIELDATWFEKEWKRDTKRKKKLYTKEIEPYTTLLNSVLDILQIDIFHSKMFTTAIKLQYPDGDQVLTTEIVTKASTPDVVFYTFPDPKDIQKQMMIVKAKTLQGTQYVQEMLEYIQKHPSFTQLIQNMCLIGEVDKQADHCESC